MKLPSLHLSTALRVSLLSSALVFTGVVGIATFAPAWAGTSIISIGSIKIINSDIDTPTGSVHVKVDGDISFAPTEDDIVSLGRKATFEERRGEHVYRLVLESSNGNVNHNYTVDGAQHSWDADAKRWFGSVLPALLREMAYDVDTRAKRIYGSGGANAVLDEIDLIHSEFSRRSYIVALAGLGKLDDKQLARVLAATDKIHSDFERRNIYVALIDHQTLDVATQIKLLQSASAIHSDFELRTMLVALAPKLTADDGVAQAWLGAMRQIHSDFEARTAVTALVDAGGKPSMTVDLALQSTQNIGSAFERRTALTEIARNMGRPSGAQVAAYAKSASRIGSDFERRTAIVTLADKAALDKAGCLELLGAIDGMSSDFEIRTTLVALARQLPKDEEVLTRYRRIARKLGDFDRGQAEKALDRLS